MASYIAPSSVNTFRNVRLRMCAMEFHAPPGPDPKRQWPPLAEQVLEMLTFSVLKDAYVLLVPTSDGQSSIPPGADSAILARTNGKGELVEIQEGEITGGVPSDPNLVMLFPRDAEYGCFWTRKREIFQAVWEDFKKDAAGAQGRHPFSSFITRSPAMAMALGVWRPVDIRREMLTTDRRGRKGNDVVHGLYGGDSLTRLGAKELEGRASYVLARSDAIGALFLADHFARVGARWREGLAETAQLFEGAKEVVAHAQERARVEALDLELGSFEAMGKTWKAGEWNEQYHEYAYLTAQARVQHDDVWQAVDMRVNSSGWKTAARKIQTEHHIPHPAANDRGDFDFRPPQKLAVMKYFDYYDFGFANRDAPWIAAVDAARAKIDDRFVALRIRLRLFLGRRSPYQSFLQELSAHAVDDPKVRKGLHEFYLQVALSNHYPWWTQFAALDDPKVWAQVVKPYVGWIETMVDAAGRGGDKLGWLFHEHLNHPNIALQYSEVLQESVRAFEGYFDRMSKYNERFEGRTVERKFGKTMEIEANFATKEFVVKDIRGESHALGPVQFMVEKGEVEVAVSERVPRAKGKGTKKVYRTVTKEVWKATVKVPFDGITRWPGWLAGFGDTVSLVLCLKDFNTTYNKSKIDAFGKVALNTFQSINSMGAAFYFTFRMGHRLPGLVRAAGPPGVLLEAIYNVKDGLLLVIPGQDSDADKAFARGDEVAGYLQRTKGWVMLLSVAPGAAALVIHTSAAVAATASLGPALMTGAAAFMGPLALGIAVGAVIVLSIDMFLWAHSGPSNLMAGFDERLGAALKKEFGSRETPGESKSLKEIANKVATVEQTVALLEG